jgi:hypothetical protein
MLPLDNFRSALTDVKKHSVDEAIRRRDEVRTGRVKPIPARTVYRRIENILADGKG